MGRFEWILIDFVVLGVLVWQLLSVQRDIRRRKAGESRPKD